MGYRGGPIAASRGTQQPSPGNLLPVVFVVFVVRDDCLGAGDGLR